MLLVELTNTINHVLSKQLQSDRVRDLFDRGVRLLATLSQVSGSGYIKRVELGLDALLNETASLQSSLPLNTWAGGVLERTNVTIACAWCNNDEVSNSFLDFLSKNASYSKRGVGLFRSRHGVVEEVRIGKDDRERWKQLSAQLFAPVSTDPQQGLTDLEVLGKVLREAAIDRLTPIFRQLLQTAPPTTLAEKKLVSSRLNQMMGEFGIAIKDPVTGRPSSVAVAPDRSGSGYFRLQAKKLSAPDENETGLAYAPRHSSVTTKLPPIELMEAPRQERLAQFRR
jgi:hypothetical protein